MTTEDRKARDELLDEVYTSLRHLAQARLANEKPGNTLQPTALVHEAWLRIAGDEAKARDFANKRQFFAAAAQAMRRILIDNARRKNAIKRGGDLDRTKLWESRIALPESVPDDELLALDEALHRLEQADPESAEIVKMRYFAGLAMEEIAEALGVNRRTVTRRWTFARTWLYKELQNG